MRAALPAFAVAAALSLLAVLVPAVGRLFIRAVQGPRWRSDPVPLAGGVAMAAGWGTGLAVGGWSGESAWALPAAAGVALMVGWVDDRISLPPLVKLAGQVAAGAVLAAGTRFALPGPEWVAGVLTVGWVVLVINAVNLFDNVDAAAGGATLIAAGACWAWWAAGSGPVAGAAALAGAAAGFLVVNLPPARLFMGDAGSHFLGTVLAGLAVLDGGRAGSGGAAPAALVLAVPVVLLAIPLGDTALVVVERLRHGRSVAVGGRDHSSHRLLALGLGLPPVLGMLWGGCLAAAGAASLAALGWQWFAPAAAVVALALAGSLVRLTRVRCYDEADSSA